MSYYKPSFNQSTGMTRGRGFGTSYRGGSGRGWGGSDRNHSNYNSVRGGPGSGSSNRFSNSFSNSFDYRNSDRYSSSRHEDYHKSYRMEPPASYSSRDHRSPERKRMRSETSSSHRNHEGFSGNDSYGSLRRQTTSGYPERRSFSGERDRHVGSSSSFSHSRDSFRKPSAPASSSRGSYRGGRERPRPRGGRMRGSSGPSRSRRVFDYGGYGGRGSVRRRATTRSSDFVRKLKIAKIRRMRVAMARIRAEDKEHTPPKKLEKDIKTEEEKSDKEDNEKVSSPVIKSPKKEEIKKKEEKKDESVSASDDEEKITSPTLRARKDFIKLVCPHCNIRCITFGKYNIHLSSSKHMISMRKVASKQKSILQRMRMAQRNTQRELEKNSEDLAPRTNFCPLCKLNYRQAKSVHQASESHKNMKKFLMPYCKTCRITFKSPIAFETHLCSIEHIKRKARSEINGNKSENESEDNDDLENFMTIDSVGELDEETPENKAEPESEKPDEKINIGIEHVNKVEVYYCDLCKMYLPRVVESEMKSLLAKHCRQRIHMQKYIRYEEDKEIQNRAERLQRKETAEKEHREKKVKVSDDDTSDKNKETKKEVNENVKEKDKDATMEEEEGDDKMWADVDKDLGDILREAESGNKSSDEEDENGRYDRFKYSEKADEEKKEEEEALKLDDGDEAQTEGEVAEKK